MKNDTFSRFTSLTNDSLSEIVGGKKKSIWYHIGDGIISFCSGFNHGATFN